jgi:hypothetical protein
VASAHDGGYCGEETQQAGERDAWLRRGRGLSGALWAGDWAAGDGSAEAKDDVDSLTQFAQGAGTLAGRGRRFFLLFLSLLTDCKMADASLWCMKSARFCDCLHPFSPMHLLPIASLVLNG